ncbi:hypothetical protein [Curtobacterium sp. PhB136]|nr:hypothetical protein [Curtobacterium sp. PhB136]TCK65843.1 hypothetical protein EDF27_0586 [Curtobacterium sp. PhB136]
MAVLIFTFVGEHLWDIVQAVAITAVTAVLTPAIQNARARRIGRRGQGR